MKPIIILYGPDEDDLNDYYSQGYRIVGVAYVPERGVRVYMQVEEQPTNINIEGGAFEADEPDIIP